MQLKIYARQLLIIEMQLKIYVMILKKYATPFKYSAMGFEKYAILWLNHLEFLIINRIRNSMINVLCS